ncbi:MAG: class I SAM-dependent methyltransferase [Rhodobacterales bacterium]|nr:class I SAM-dependent methyltransferase [Rhodobacterales bacterium]
MPQHNTLPVAEPDSAFVDFWNAVLAPKFIRFRHILVDGLSRHSAAVMPALPVRAGDRVLDVGCGFGDTALDLANRVGPQGRVLGVDCCDAFLDCARQIAGAAGTANLDFARHDAELGLGGAEYDFVFARFGTMFFSNPVRGLRSMREALKPGARMAHIVWRRREDNPWLHAPATVVRQFLPAPGEDAQTCGPGPFSMANEIVTGLKMEAAGFTDIHFQRIDAKVLVGRTIREAIDFQLAIGPAGETFREAGALAEQKRPEIEAALTDLFARAETTEEGLWMDSSSWLITARAPDA